MVDLIPMDMQMTVKDGTRAIWATRATRAIRQRPDHARRPITAMTANAFSEDRQACIDAGMNGHSAKPVEPAAQYATVRKWLETAERDRKASGRK